MKNLTNKEIVYIKAYIKSLQDLYIIWSFFNPVKKRRTKESPKR